MKIQCDFCSAEEAALFCCADEAALCVACDRSVHGANRLAGKHRRVPLLRPPPQSPPHPPCDKCQERRGLLFCREDRAIMCTDCDVSAHGGANALTARHSRFLLTGVQLSTSAVEAEELEVVNETSIINNNNSSNINSNISSSSISEYLINTLPGWRVEDFLIDTNSATAAGSLYDEVDEGLLFTETLPISGYAASPAKESSHGGKTTMAAAANRKQQRRSRDAYTVPHFQTGCSSKRNRRTTSLW